MDKQDEIRNEIMDMVWGDGQGAVSKQPIVEGEKKEFPKQKLVVEIDNALRKSGVDTKLRSVQESVALLIQNLSRLYL